MVHGFQSSASFESIGHKIFKASEVGVRGEMRYIATGAAAKSYAAFLPRNQASRLQAPPPAAAKYRNTKQ